MLARKILFSAVGQFNGGAFEGSGALKDENDLVGTAVFVVFELAEFFFRLAAVGDDILVEEHGHPTGVNVAPARNIGRFQVMMSQGAVRDLLQLFAFEQFDTSHPGWRTNVIHDRECLVESFRGDNVFIGDSLVFVTAVGSTVAMKPDVVFARDLSESLILWHLANSSLQITSCFLLLLECFKQRFEITFTKTFRAFA